MSGWESLDDTLRGPKRMLSPEPLAIRGAWVAALSRRTDERGSFARVWCQRENVERGGTAEMVQANLAHSLRRGTLRGLHYQTAPFQEAKSIVCLRGAIWDVMIDLRPDSPTFLRWLGIELSADSPQQIHVPAGCAHGYQTLADDTDVLYHSSAFYTPEAERGIRWDDPRFGIQWPLPDAPIISAKDRAWPDFDAQSMLAVSVTGMFPGPQ